MVANLVFSLNTVLPIYLIILVGFLLRKAGLIDNQFADTASRVAFTVGFPCTAFREIMSAATSTMQNPGFIAYVMGMTVFVYLVSLASLPLFVKERSQRGAALHGMFRGNYIAIGTLMASNVFGAPGVATLVTLFPFIIPLYVSLAVFAFIMFAPSNNTTFRGHAKHVIRSIISTPVLYGVLAGIVCSNLHIVLPDALTSTISTVANVAIPLSLFAIGGQLNLSFEKVNWTILNIVSAVKLFIIPLLAVCGAIFLGFNA